MFLDFDGTLSRIVPKPEDAQLVDGASDALGALADAFALVAIVSGRSLEDLKTRIGSRRLLLAGAYGRDRSDRTIRRRTEGWEPVAIAARAALDGLDGVEIERKGAGLGLHYRAAPELAEDVARIADVLAREFNLEVRPGRKVYELVVPGPGKGDAIVSLVAERALERALVCGDDWGDLEAFVELRSRGIDAVIVAVSSPEAPPTLTEHADVVVEGPDELVAFLRRLASAAAS